MQTKINKISDVEFDLEITATADDLSEDLEKVIRAQRGRTTMKGFRPGHVPLSLVKKVYGKSLAYGVAEDTVQKTYETRVLKADEYEVLGQPKITNLSYEYEGDLRAVVRFGIRPRFKLMDLSKTKINRLIHEVTVEEVEKEIDAMRARHAELIPDDGPITGESFIIVDMQRMDGESGTPLVGKKQEDVSILLSDENVLPQLKDGVIGKKAGESVTVSLPAPEGEEGNRTYEIELKEVKRRELPELDEELIEQISNDKFSDLEAFQAEIRRQLEAGWKRRATELFESDAISSAIDLHDFQIPESVIEMYLDAYVRDAKSQSGGELPQNFDEAHFRKIRRDEAERQARWMFIRDHIIETCSLKLTDEEHDAFFERTADDGLPAETMKKYYQAVPNMMEQLDQRLLSEKVFAWIAEQVEVEEMGLEAYQEAVKNGDDA